MTSDLDLNMDLVATEKHVERIPLSYLRCDEATDLLGVWLAPNGNRKNIISVLKAAAVKWGGNMRRVNSSRQEA